jgi:hypothetical protein
LVFICRQLPGFQTFVVIVRRYIGCEISRCVLARTHAHVVLSRCDKTPPDEVRRTSVQKASVQKASVQKASARTSSESCVPRQRFHARCSHVEGAAHVVAVASRTLGGRR